MADPNEAEREISSILNESDLLIASIVENQSLLRLEECEAYVAPTVLLL
jgi:hypothetical protein